MNIIFICSRSPSVLLLLDIIITGPVTIFVLLMLPDTAGNINN